MSIPAKLFDDQSGSWRLQTLERMRVKSSAKPLKRGLGSNKTSPDHPRLELYQLCSFEHDTVEGNFAALPMENIKAGDEWRGYLAIQAFLKRNKTDDQTYYGFFGANFNKATSFSREAIISHVDAVGRHYDVILFAPYSDQQCLFINTIEEAEYFVPGFADLADAVYRDSLGMGPVAGIVMDVRHSVINNGFVAKPKFWRAWLAENQKMFSPADGRESNLRSRLSQTVAYAGRETDVKGLVVDRTASLMLATQPHWKVKTINSFWMPFSKREPFVGKVGVVDAVALDALKFAYREKSQQEYLATFIAARRNFFTDHPAPFGADVLLYQTNGKVVKQTTGDVTLGGVPSQSVGADKNPQTQVKSLSLVDLLSRADALSQASRQNDAIQLYRDWVNANQSDQAYVAFFNLGCMLSSRGDLQEALDSYRHALRQRSNFPQAQLNVGSALERMGRKDEAMAAWGHALEMLSADPQADISLKLHALNSMGRVLEIQHKYAESEAMLTRSLAVKPDQSDVLHHLVHLRQKQCNWPIYSPLPGVSEEVMVKATSALATLSASNDPALQLEIALKYGTEKVRNDLPPLAEQDGYRHERLRVGYLSSNFGMHAVSILTAELYELHDRNRFEVYGFCWSPEDNSPMRERVKNAMDHFVRIDRMSDEEAAIQVRSAEIDILIDLQGQTSGCRPNIIAHRPAPIQITWLGFPGTTGLPGIDYVLADRYVIPDNSACYFTERPLYLPNCFQVNDRKRASGPLPLRSSYNLPENEFVFCAFNHNHKFTPELFAVWMRILLKTPGSVLWLLGDNEQVRNNLLTVARLQGVAEDRLIFAPRVPPTEYLARFPLADLFLDTLPFNGGTTVSDALWMGLPVLTCSGQTFASRMAGSLLKAIDAPELITTTLKDYEDLAVMLAADQPMLKKIRCRIEANRDTSPLFDTPRFVKDLEAVYEKVAIKP